MTDRTFIGAVSGDSNGLARLAGVLYLLTIPTTGAWYGISGSLLGADATLASVEAGRGMLELAIILGAIGHVNHLLVVVLLHRLLRPFGKLAADLALLFLAVSVPVSFAAVARQMDILALLDARAGLPPLDAELLQAQLTLTAHAYTSLFDVQSIFWGLWLLPLGWLLLRSGLVPRVLAVLLLLGVPFYVLSFVGTVLDPDYATSLFGRVVGIATGLPEVIGEVGTALWLTFAGARAWRAQPAAAAG